MEFWEVSQKNHMHINSEEKINGLYGKKIDCNEKYKKGIINALNHYKELIVKNSQIGEKYMHKVRDSKNIRTNTYAIPQKYKNQVNHHLRVNLGRDN